MTELGDFSSSHEIIYNRDRSVGIESLDNRDTILNDILWITGNVPENEKDWALLETLKTRVVFNFSFFPLKRRSGFEIINITPQIVSIVMPMTPEENKVAEDFTHVLHIIQNAKRIYICGEKNHRDAFSLVLASRRGIKIPNDKNLPDIERMLVRKYTGS